ncbi:MAG: FKBP-type peptidyl-prolyl cis-trans isomerase [Tidjanibacter sp.]|nr:FKBP-type peptidyl-prolyl cis-trans isomerase [Tidjanibacter sp.]
MRFYQHRLILLAAAVGLLAGCAKTGSVDYDALEAQSLDAWMAANTDLTDKAFEKTASGLYIYWVKQSDHSSPADSLAEVNDWVRVNYTGKTLQENIFYTRNEKTARRQGTFTRRTHYVPNFLFLAETNTTMAPGMYEALQKMTVGDIVRLYIPSKLYNGSTGYSSDNIGYNGQWGADGSKPVIIDSLTLMEISSDPIVSENAAVKKIAAAWGLDVETPFRDSTGFYLKNQTPLPFQRDSVAADSTLSFYYKTTFTDGFVVDSNIDSVQLRAWGEVTTKGPQKWNMTTTSSSGDDYYNGTEAMKVACSSACYGDRLKFVVTSAYAYGISGQSGTRTTESSSSSSSSYSDYINQLNYYSYLNSMYSYGNYGYSGYYNNYYSSMYYNSLYGSSSSSSSTTEEDETTKVIVTTEILPFTPLIYEVWIVPSDGSGDKPDGNTE